MASFGPHADRHAVQRAAERHGIGLSHDLAESIALDIIGSVDGTNPTALMLARCQRRRTEVWLVNVHGRDLHVVWCPERAVIVTVLP